MKYATYYSMCINTSKWDDTFQGPEYQFVKLTIEELYSEYCKLVPHIGEHQYEIVAIELPFHRDSFGGN